MKGLFLRGNTWWFEQMREGKRLRRSLATSDEAQAIIKARELRFEVESAPPKLPADLLLEEYLQFLRVERNLSERYVNEVAMTLRRFLREKRVSKNDPGNPLGMSAESLRAWAENLPAKLVSSTTREHYLGFINRFYKFAGSSTQAVLRITRQPVRRSYAPLRVIKKLLRVPASDELRFCLLCGLHAGLRKEEVIESRRSWFDLRTRTLHVKRSETWEPKDDEERVIPLTDTFVRFLRKFPKRKPEEYMLAPWKLQKGKWRYRYDFRRPFVAYMKKQGHSSITFHDLRRSFASNLASSGESLYLIAKWLGDDPRVVAKTYAHISPDTRGKIDALG